MTCAEYKQLLAEYPDLPKEEKEALLRHAMQCEACHQALMERETLHLSLGALDEDEAVPEAFGTGWRQAVREDAKPRSSPWEAWRGRIAVAAALVVVIGGTALTRAGILFPGSLDLAQPAAQVETYAYDESAIPYAALDAAPAAGSMAKSDMGQEAVVLYSASLSLQSTQFDADMRRIEALLAQHGGQMAYQSTYGEPIANNPDAGRYAYLELRIPTAALDAFLEEAGQIGETVRMERSVEDVSESYYDTQGRLDMYTAQRDRLLALMEEASISELIEIEERLGELQYTLDTLQGRINYWDSRAADAVVTVSLEETAPQGTHPRMPLGQRLGTALRDAWHGFGAFLADMLVFLVRCLPYAACLAVAVAVIGMVYWGIKRKDKKEKK